MSGNVKKITVVIAENRLAYILHTVVQFSKPRIVFNEKMSLHNDGHNNDGHKT